MARPLDNAKPLLDCGALRAGSRGAAAAPLPPRQVTAVLWTLWILVAAVCFVLRAPVLAQVSREYQLKAVFLWRLAQFTQWPSEAFEAPDHPIVICVLGGNPFGDALAAAVRDETAHGRKLVVQHHQAIEQTKACHILYLTGAGPRQAKEIGGALAGRSVLTVSDGDAAVANFYDSIVKFLTERNKIKLRINLKAAQAAGLVLDPRLLRAAEITG